MVTVIASEKGTAQKPTTTTRASPVCSTFMVLAPAPCWTSAEVCIAESVGYGTGAAQLISSHRRSSQREAKTEEDRERQYL